MNRVYILGAGASRDLKFRITVIDGGYVASDSTDFDLKGPLSSGYFYYMNNIFKEVERKVGVFFPVELTERLVGYISICANISKNDLLKNENLSKKLNVEELYLNIESDIENIEPDNKSSYESGLSLLGNEKYLSCVITKEDLLDYIFDSLSFLGYYCFSQYHAILAKHIVKSGGDVISFNWDILFDEAMFNTNQWSYVDGYGLKFGKIISKSGDSLTYSKESKNLILKPHGSINWYRKLNNENMFLILPAFRRLRGGTPLGQLQYREKINSSVVRGCIVPPGKKRKQFPEIWKKIHALLEKANEIITIGFSFNNNDPHVREEFQRTIFRDDLIVKLVNPSSEDLIRIYKGVFRTQNIQVISETFSEFCNGLTGEEIALVEENVRDKVDL